MRKLNCFLDLDETLLSSVPADEMTASLKQKLDAFDYVKMDDQYYVVKRPHIGKFLDFLFSNFNVSVWTAASCDYCCYIVKNIILTKPERKIDYLFHSYNCDISKKIGDGIKDLAILWDKYKLEGYGPANTFIVDDNPEVERTGYCIQIPEFNFTDDDASEDRVLLDLMDELRDKLAGRADVAAE